MRIEHVEITNFRGIKSLSWKVNGNFNCIIGPGDTCKTTILTAMDYTLSPRSNLFFDDSDFFNQNVAEDIVIQITLTNWDEKQPEVKRLFQESKFAQYKCGITDSGPLDEPGPDGRVALSVSLRVDKSLEPKWSVVKGRDEMEDQDRKPIYASDRAAIGLTRIDTFSDFHFSWGRNTILTRLSINSDIDLNGVVLGLSRNICESDISQNESIQACQMVANTIKEEAQNAGVYLSELSPKMDMQRQAVGNASISLHENSVPLRNKGSGTKRLIGTAMQMKLYNGKSISIIDEVESGLEPHRIRGLIYKLKNSGQQIFTTTHSPVVIRELSLLDDEIHVCKRHKTGTVSLHNLSIVPDIQRQLRANAEAFLGGKIIGCEGATEVGCLRAYDIYRLDKNNPPVWSLATSYLDCNGASNIKPVCDQLITIGYKTAVLCDNDAPNQLSTADVMNLRGAGAHVCQWEEGNSTEHQVFADLPWEHIPQVLLSICSNHDTLEHPTIIDNIIKTPEVQAQALGRDPTLWPESQELRKIMGKLASKGKWIKRIDYAEKLFSLILPLLPQESTLKVRLNDLWSWIQK